MHIAAKQAHRCLVKTRRAGIFGENKICKPGDINFSDDYMALTLRQLKYFVATAELGQISQAAIQLTI